MVRTRLYRDGVLTQKGFPIAEVSDHIADPDNVIWFDLCSPAPDDLKVIAEELGLHELAVEDVFNDHQRPKLDVYDSHLFLTMYGVRLEEDRLVTVEISVFVTSNALVTVRENDGFDIDEVVKRWDASRDLARHGVPFLLHGLLDTVVDTQFSLIEHFDDGVDELENELFAGDLGNKEMQRRTFGMRKKMVAFRRVVLPMREVLNSLIRRDLKVVGPEMAPYYQDVYDHTLRLAEWADSLRELIGNIRDTYMTQQGNRMNEIMKKVTSWAAIIAVPTMITGFYGQNLPYPGAQQSWGFWTSTLLVFGVSALLYMAFKKRDWL